MFSLNTFKKVCRFVSDRSYRVCVFASLKVYDHLLDRKFLEKMFRARMGRPLDLDNPQTFNEKLQYLKLFDRQSKYNVFADKYLVRDYIADTIGVEYLIPLLGTWDSPEKIDFDALPSKFVIKCNHNSGLGMYICKDKSKMDVTKVRRELAKGLKQDYYLVHREWPYKDIPRRILAEQYLENSEVGGLTDYKIHCFNGVPKFILVCKDRFAPTGLTEDFFTTEWEHMPVKRPNIPNATTPILKPEKLDEMLSLAEKLSKDIPFLRVDFYYVDGKIYFSELTFFPASGFAPFEPEEWDKTFGDWLVLPAKQTQN